jgi:hypothetical protein
MVAYLVDLPVTTEIAYVGGREIWSYPSAGKIGVLKVSAGPHKR